MKTPESGDVFRRASNGAWIMLVQAHESTKTAIVEAGKQKRDYLLVRLTKNRYNSDKVTEILWTTGDYYTLNGIEEAIKAGLIKYLFNLGEVMETTKQKIENGR